MSVSYNQVYFLNLLKYILFYTTFSSEIILKLLHFYSNKVPLSETQLLNILNERVLVKDHLVLLRVNGDFSIGLEDSSETW